MTITGENLVAECVGHTVSGICLSKGDTCDELEIDFEGGGRLLLWDDGQDCCENRYMTAEDDLAGCVGGKLVGIELRNAPDREDEHGEVHECQFLHIITDRQTAVVSSHNEHNGYYGGFSIQSRYTAVDDGGEVP